MGKYYDVKGKTAERILEEMTNLEAYAGTEVFEMQKSAIQVRIADQVCTTIDGARTEFIKMIGNLTRSIDQFRESNERSSNAIIFLTKALVFLTAIQAAKIIFDVVKAISKF
jgi:hypothetical protein